MRTRTLFAAALMLAAGSGLLTAQSNVYSINVRLTGSGRYDAVANPLNSTNNTFGSVLKQLPNRTQILKWNHAIADYNVFTKGCFGDWCPPGAANMTLNPGEGVLILSSVPSTNTFVGEILQGSLTNSFPSGYELRASQVPQAGLVSELGLVPPNGSAFLKWDASLGVIGDWVVYNRTPFGTWSPSEPRLEIGESFLLHSPVAFDWVRNFTVQ